MFFYATNKLYVLLLFSVIVGAIVMRVRLSFAYPSLNLRSTYRQGKQLLFISRCIFNHFVFFPFSLNSGYYFKTEFCIKSFSYGVVIKYI